MSFPNGETFMSSGNYDVFVASISTTGVVSWVRTWGGPGDDEATGVVVDSKGNILVSGYFTGPSISIGSTMTVSTAGMTGMFLVRLGSDGTIQSAAGYGNGNGLDRMFVTVDSKDNVILTGLFDGTVDFGAGTPLDSGVAVGMFGAALFMAKLDPNGMYLHQREIGKSGFAAILATAVVPKTDAFVVTGATFQPIDLGNGMTQGTSMVASPIVAEYAP
jgi:hypothetical protein